MRQSWNICLLIMLSMLVSGCSAIKSGLLAGKNKKLLSEEEQKQYFLLTIFGTSKESRGYLLLETAEERSNYMNIFWSMYDTDLGTERNSFYVEVQKRFSYAKLKFKYMRTSGEKSALGRIYIKYGPPIDIVRNPAEISREEYEEVVVWEYDFPKMFKVAFKDERGTGNYQIIPNYDTLPNITGPGFRQRSMKEVIEWRKQHEMD